MWMKNNKDRSTLEFAENRPFLRRFIRCEPAGQQSEDCYTFEGFAPNPDVIRTTYYYHYKRNISGLKEETTWS
jgi:hypothetical protein